MILSTEHLYHSVFTGEQNQNQIELPSFKIKKTQKADVWLLRHKQHYLLQTGTHRPGDFAAAGQWGMACSSAGRSGWQKPGCWSAAAGASLCRCLEGLRCLQSSYSEKRLCMFQLLGERGQGWTTKDISEPPHSEVKVLGQLCGHRTGEEHWKLMQLFVQHKTNMEPGLCS